MWASDKSASIQAAVGPDIPILTQTNELVSGMLNWTEQTIGSSSGFLFKKTKKYLKTV